ncbi:MAG: hypothetical protein CL535_07195 [Ahrensia sp.]|nr:hypothetical protein [Ahrensia sp.]
MFLNVAIFAGVLAPAAILLSPRLSRLPLWRAVITPLASIIGSGFLILGPLLDDAYGYLAPAVMAALCLAAFAFGWAVRYNIANISDDTDTRGHAENHLETASSWALAFAYIVSVAYYLNLFGAFGVSLTPFDDPFYARVVTTAAFALILVLGWGHGFKALEHLEYYSVAAKLAIIVGLLIGMAVYFWHRAAGGSLVVIEPRLHGWGAVTLAFGLIVTVQGFETSRYLGEEYDPPTRIRSMRLAQGVSTVIYMIYVVLIAYVFQRSELKMSETAIVDMMQFIAPVLPALLVVAALTAQMSAAVADTSGTGGLFAELSGERIGPRVGYLIIVLAGVTLTWIADVYEIIAYASRAFALYYGLQAAIALTTARRRKHPVLHAAGFLALALLAAAIVLFGQPAEG